MEGTRRTQILERLNLGSSVAENDDNLERYFVPTVALDDFLSDRYDLIRGAKGSGKSAILRMVSRESSSYDQLADVLLVTATEHSGEPAFKRAFESILLDQVEDGALVDAWKAYIINLVLDAVEELPSCFARDDAIRYAESCGLRYRTTSSFKKIWWSILRMVHIRSVSVGPESLTAEFPDTPPDFWTKNDTPVDFPEALRRAVVALEGNNKRCWVLMDRLDAAFQDRQNLERRALRSLLIAYKDFMGHRAIRVKLFLRTDLYDTVTRGVGFRELTHVADRTSSPIAWDPDKLLQFLMERFAFNSLVCERYGFSRTDIDEPDLRVAAFFSVFPPQIDVGKRKGDSWTWMCSRIRDGSGTRTPRDLLSLVVNAAQKEREQLALGKGEEFESLISASAVKLGLSVLSEDKVRTTLLAENPHLEHAIRAFRDQKAEQNAETLATLLGGDWSSTVEQLVRIGFLERLTESWKVPILYRDGLNVIQGAAFLKGVVDDE